ERGGCEHDEPGDEHKAATEEVGHPRAEQEKPAVREDVAVDHPLQALLTEAEILLDRRQGDVEDRRVEDVHELDEAQQKQDRDAAPGCEGGHRPIWGGRLAAGGGVDGHESALAFSVHGSLSLMTSGRPPM